MVRITKPPQVRRKEILDAALTLFIEKGYEKTAVSDIVKELKVSQGLFYYYFKSKEEVFAAAIEQWADEFATVLIAILADSSLPVFKRVSLTILEMETMAKKIATPLAADLHHLAETVDIHLRLSVHVTQLLVEPISEIIAELNEKGITQVSDPVTMAAFIAFGVLGMLHGNPAQEDYNHTLESAMILELFPRILGIAPEQFQLL